jgi:hypothetical protein
VVRTAPTVREGVRSRRYLTTTVPDAGHAHDWRWPGLADRLGGIAQYSSPRAKLALIASVYSEQDQPVAEVLRRTLEP